MAESGKKSSLYEQTLHSRGIFSNVWLRTQYHKSWCEVFMWESSCTPMLSQRFHRSELSGLQPYQILQKKKTSTLAAKFCHINGLYLGGMDPELLVCVLLSVFGEKMLVFYLFGQQNISLKQSVIAMQAIWVPSSIISIDYTVYQVEQLSSCVNVNENSLWNFIFLALQSSARVSEQAVTRHYVYNDCWEDKSS